MGLIPSYLSSDKPVFIRLAEHSKAPKQGNSPKGGPFFNLSDSEIQDHVQSGGNVGRVLRDDLVALDVDHGILLDELEDWPDTLVIESGGSDVGYHYYYRVPTWNQDQTGLSDSSRDIGGIRNNTDYCLVPPSRHDETGNKYTVSNPRNPAEISVSRLSSLVERYGPANTAAAGGSSSGGGAGSVGGSSIPTIPSGYPNQEAEWATLRSWLSGNGLLESFNQASSSDWSGLEFKLAKCLAEGGFSEPSISNALDRLHRNSKWHSRDSRYRTRTVRKAIQAACNDSHVEFTTPDDGKESGSDLPEGKQNRGSTTMSGNDSTFESKESVVEHNSDGDAVQARLMKGTDGDSGETFEYVDVATGSIKETETVNGETVEVPQINDGPGEASSLGSPEKLDLKIQALQKLKEQIE